MRNRSDRIIPKQVIAIAEIRTSTVFYWRNAEQTPEILEPVDIKTDITSENKIRTLQARIYQLEEENLILRKAAKLLSL